MYGYKVEIFVLGFIAIILGLVILGAWGTAKQTAEDIAECVRLGKPKYECRAIVKGKQEPTPVIVNPQPQVIYR